MNRSSILTGPYGVRLDADSRVVTVDGRRAPLSTQAFAILELLLRRRGTVASFGDLAREVWGYEEPGNPHFIQAAVWRLRRALKSVGCRCESGGDELIESVPRIGYVIRRDEPDLTQVDGWNAKHPVVIVNRVGQIRFANDAASRLTGYPLEELRQMMATDIWAPGDQDTHRALRESAIEGSTAAASGPARRGDGTVAAFDVSLVPLDLGTGEPLFLITAGPSADTPAPAADSSAGPTDSSGATPPRTSIPRTGAQPGNSPNGS